MDEVKALKVGEQIDVSTAVEAVKIEKRHSEKKNVDYTVVILELVTGEDLAIFCQRADIRLLVSSSKITKSS